MDVDWQKAAQEMVRALRGKSTQAALSRRMGFKTNVFYRWESGQRQIRISELVRLLSVRHSQYRAALWTFSGQSRPVTGLEDDWDWPSWLKALRGEKSVDALAEELDLKASALRRIFRGDSDPALSRLLPIIQSLTGRIVDFIDIMVDASQISAIQPYWQVVDAQRRIARDHMNAEAIIAALEIEGYRNLREHSNEWIAGRLSLPVPEVEETLKALEQAGAIRRHENRYRVQSHRHVNTRHLPEVWSTLTQFWAERAMDLPPEFCRRGYLVFSANEEAIKAVNQIYVSAHYEAVKVIQEGLNPTRVVAISTQAAFLDGKPKI